jgi:hypothetical protein
VKNSVSTATTTLTRMSKRRTEAEAISAVFRYGPAR